MRVNAGCPRRAGFAGSPNQLLLWAIRFVYAGSSALLLLLVHSFPGFWYLSAIALLPLLYKLNKSAPFESMLLGALLGVAFFVPALSYSLLAFSPEALAMLLGGVTLCAGFGFAVSFTRLRLGFNPLITSLLWVGFEFALVKLGITQRFFGEVYFANPLLGRISVLFGFLLVSFMVVLFNSVLLETVERTIELFESEDECAEVYQEKCYHHLAVVRIARHAHLIPEGRGPP